MNTQGGASYQFEDGKLKLNVTQTDNFVSVDSESNYTLAEGVALSAKVKVQNSRGHFALGIADGNSTIKAYVYTRSELESYGDYRSVS